MKKTPLFFSFIAAAIISISSCAADSTGSAQKQSLAASGSPASAAIDKSAEKHQTSKAAAEINKTDTKENAIKVTNNQNKGFKTVSNGWFSYEMPSSWNANTNPEEDEEYKVYEAKMFPPKSGQKMSSYIYVSYFAEDNEDIPTYEQFINVNSQNILRKGKQVEWEKYEPVTETKIAGRKAYVVARNCRHFLHPNSKDDSYVMKKEKMYVLPASKGYYVIRYAAEEPSFPNNLQAFEKIAASFKGKY